MTKNKLQMYLQIILIQKAKTTEDKRNIKIELPSTDVKVVGVVMLVKAIMELVNAIQQQDNSGIFHAGRSIAVALLMVAIKPVVGLFVTGL